jgi:hypothetical protein
MIDAQDREQVPIHHHERLGVVLLAARQDTDDADPGGIASVVEDADRIEKYRIVSYCLLIQGERSPYGAAFLLDKLLPRKDISSVRVMHVFLA